MTTQTITDWHDWRAGDDVRVEWPDGSVLTSRLEAGAGALWAAGRVIYVRADTGDPHAPDGRTITVTREVPDIPEPTEPTEPWALVRFERGAVLYRDPDERGWVDFETERFTWEAAQEIYGRPIAVSLPNWSDAADTSTVLPRLAEEAGQRAFKREADEDAARTALAQAYDAGHEMGEKGSTGGLRLAMLRLRIEALADELAESADRYGGGATVSPLLRHLAGRVRDLAAQEPA